MEGFAGKVKNLIAKAKTIKNIEIIVGVVIICIIALIYSTVTSGGSTKKSNSNAKTAISTDITSEMEGKLAAILSEIEGAGQVKVMITYKTTPEIVTANTKNIHSNTSSGVTTVTETVTPIVVTNNGKSELIIVKQLMPEIKGVIIVSEGASNIKVRLSLLRAAQAVLGVDANAIEIFAMK